SPEPMDLTIGFNAWSAGTSGPVTGPAVLAPETDDELLAAKEKLKGAWVISTTRGPEKYRVAYDEAGIAGVVRSAGGELILTSRGFWAPARTSGRTRKRRPKSRPSSSTTAGPITSPAFMRPRPWLRSSTRRSSRCRP